MSSTTGVGQRTHPGTHPANWKRIVAITAGVLGLLVVGVVVTLFVALSRSPMQEPQSQGVVLPVEVEHTPTPTTTPIPEPEEEVEVLVTASAPTATAVPTVEPIPTELPTSVPVEVEDDFIVLVPEVTRDEVQKEVLHFRVEFPEEFASETRFIKTDEEWESLGGYEYPQFKYSLSILRELKMGLGRIYIGKGQVLGPARVTFEMWGSRFCIEILEP